MHNKRLGKFVSIVLAGTAVWLTMPATVGCGGGMDYSEAIEQITALIKQRMQEDEVTGLSIALVDGQEVVWAQGFGYADKENDVKATTETIYEIGSVSKTMTATAIMQLAEEGLIDIDDPLTKYLPEFSIQPPLRSGPTPAGPITIRTMLTHHSGITGDLFNGAFALKPNPAYNERLLDYLHDDYASYATNFVWSYSNTAFSLLGEVVARVSGQSFEEYTDRLFEDMGMHHSSFFLNKPFLKENLSKGYFKEQAFDHLYINIPAAGSVLSNVSDMAEYIKMVLADGKSADGSVLRAETLAEMLTPQNKDIPLDAGWQQGLSWFLTDYGLDYAGQLCWHSGGTVVFNSRLEILRDHQLGVVVLSNSGTAGAVVEEVVDQALKLALQAKAGIEPVEPPGPPYSPYTARPQEELEALAGIYVGGTTQAGKGLMPGGGYDIVKALPGRLEWIGNAGSNDPEMKTTYHLVPLENGRFSLPDSQEFQIEFAEISGRNVMVWHGGIGFLGSNMMGEKYDPVPVPQVWQERLGQYEITNLDPQDCSSFVPEELRIISLSIELEERDGMLVIGCIIQPAPLRFVIEPLTDTLGVIHGLGRRQGGTVQIVMVDGQEQIQLLGGLYKRS
ncbi:serine hydrolase domain-containing protein [Chloroflexota bacterium]